MEELTNPPRAPCRSLMHSAQCFRGPFARRSVQRGSFYSPNKILLSFSHSQDIPNLSFEGKKGKNICY